MNTFTEPDFDRIARIYRWAEYASLGPLLQRTRTHFLLEMRDRKLAMMLGDGDGRFLARLMEQNPEMQAEAVDTSEVMLQLLRRNCLRTSPDCEERLTLLRGSALELVPLPEIDLVVTHFFLDCLTQTQVDTLTKNYAAVLTPGTLWVVSDFAVPHAAWLRPIAATYIRLLYFAFRLLTGLHVTRLPNPQCAFEQAGFTRRARKEFVGGLLYTEIWRLG